MSKGNNKGKNKGRPSTFQGWVVEESSDVKKISVEQFLEENPGYESGYTQAYNACMTAGCSRTPDGWSDPNGRVYENVFDCFTQYARSKV